MHLQGLMADIMRMSPKEARSESGGAVISVELWLKLAC